MLGAASPPRAEIPPTPLKPDQRSDSVAYAAAVQEATDSALEQALERLTSLRQYQHHGKRVPHKPLLVLLALGQLETTGSSAVPWDLAQDKLADLITEFGPQTRTGRKQSAAYPFTRLRSDGVWTIDADIPNDLVGSLDAARPTGRLEAQLERQLRSAPVRNAVARALVEAHFPDTVAPDVLLASGLDPDSVLRAGLVGGAQVVQRQRSRRWVAEILKAWDECCAFCGYDGRLGTTPVGIEAAHVRWFNLGGPDDLDNGMALCSLHHKLFDRGALGLSQELTLLVSPAFTARTEASKRVTTYTAASSSRGPERSCRRSSTAPGTRSRCSGQQRDGCESAPKCCRARVASRRASSRVSLGTALRRSTARSSSSSPVWGTTAEGEPGGIPAFAGEPCATRGAGGWDGGGGATM